MFRFYAPIMYGLTDGILGALEGAATGAAGAAMLSAVGYTDYDIADAAKTGALGRGVLSAYFSARSIKLTSCGFFSKNISPHFFSFSNAFLASTHLGLQILSGFLGNSIIKACDDTHTTTDESICAVALGATVMLVPIWLIDTYLYKHIAPGLQRCGNAMKFMDSIDETLDDDYVDEIRRMRHGHE
jgi:hypothetical protein